MVFDTDSKIRKKDFYYPFLETIFFRKISRLISVPLSKTKISANMITATRPIIALVAFWLILRGDYSLSVVGGGVLLIYFIIDKTDGEVARLKNEESKFGKVLDSVVDLSVDSLVYVILMLSCFIKTGNFSLIYYSVFALWLFWLSAYLIAKIQDNFEVSISKIKNSYFENPNLIIKIATFIFGNIYTPSVLYTFAFLALIFNQIPLFFYFFIVSYIILAIYLFRLLYKCKV